MIHLSNDTSTTTTIRAEIAGRLWDIEVCNSHSPYGKGRYSYKQGRYIEPVTRIFTDTPDEFEDIFYSALGAPRPEVGMFPHLALESVYTSRKQYPEVDRAWDRHNRAYIKAQSAVLNAVKEITKVEEFRFDRRAGCTCPCSPGFLAKSGENRYGTTIHVNLTPIP